MRILLFALVFLTIGGSSSFASASPLPRYYLSGSIAEDSDTYLAEFLKENPGPVEVIINSRGGSQDASIKMGQAIAAHGKVICKVRDFAASGAFYVLTECAVRIAGPKSLLMTHRPRIVFNGLIDLETASEIWADLVKAAASWDHLCSKKLKITPKQYAEKVRSKDWFMSPQEALAVGVIDRIEP